MSFYGRLQATATRLIRQYGVSSTFTAVSQGVYDGSTGSYIETETTYTASIVRDTWSKTELADSSIQSSDIKLIAESAAYKVGDTVQLSSGKHRIFKAEPIEPGDTNCCYILWVRK